MLTYKLSSLVETEGITAEVAFSTKTLPEGFDPGSASWRVTLKRGRKRLTTDYYTGPAITNEPTASGVLYSLIMDAQCATGTFEDFCSDFGHSFDSRNAEQIYKACKAKRPKLEKFLGAKFDLFMRAEE